MKILIAEAEKIALKSTVSDNDKVTKYEVLCTVIFT